MVLHQALDIFSDETQRLSTQGHTPATNRLTDDAVPGMTFMTTIDSSSARFYTSDIFLTLAAQGILHSSYHGVHNSQCECIDRFPLTPENLWICSLFRYLLAEACGCLLNCSIKELKLKLPRSGGFQRIFISDAFKRR